MKYIALALLALLIVGCGGGGGGGGNTPGTPVVPRSSWEGQWSGSWNDPATRLQGSIQIRIDGEGRITGYLGGGNANTIAHITTGTVQENGWTDFYYEYGNGAGPYHWTGNFSGNYSPDMLGKIAARGQIAGPSGEFWTGNAFNLTKQ